MHDILIFVAIKVQVHFIPDFFKIPMNMNFKREYIEYFVESKALE